MLMDDNDMDEGYFYYNHYIDDDLDSIAMERIRKDAWNAKHNIVRDKRGRLNKGALLASKDNCQAEKILLRYASGMSVREMVECLGCSKSTVYNVIKKYRGKTK